jgi:hypothetical protein
VKGRGGLGVVGDERESDIRGSRREGDWAVAEGNTELSRGEEIEKLRKLRLRLERRRNRRDEMRGCFEGEARDLLRSE